MFINLINSLLQFVKKIGMRILFRETSCVFLTKIVENERNFPIVWTNLLKLHNFYEKMADLHTVRYPYCPLYGTEDTSISSSIYVHQSMVFHNFLWMNYCIVPYYLNCTVFRHKNYPKRTCLSDINFFCNIYSSTK